MREKKIKTTLKTFTPTTKPYYYILLKNIYFYIFIYSFLMDNRYQVNDTFLLLASVNPIMSDLFYLEQG